MKHTKESCTTCAVELTDANWNSSWRKTNRTQCKDCNNPNRKKHNPNRMYVNGKYVPKSHPLYKSGRYKNFESAAFSALQGYEKSNVGYVYAVCNPAWKGWYKVGMAVDAADRCSGYQTSSPFRDYKVSYSKYFEDRREAERLAHSALKENKIEHANEWFKTDLETIKNIIKNIKDVQHEA